MTCMFQQNRHTPIHFTTLLTLSHVLFNNCDIHPSTFTRYIHTLRDCIARKLRQTRRFWPNSVRVPSNLDVVLCIQYSPLASWTVHVLLKSVPCQLFNSLRTCPLHISILFIRPYATYACTTHVIIVNVSNPSLLPQSSLLQTQYVPFVQVRNGLYRIGFWGLFVEPSCCLKMFQFLNFSVFITYTSNIRRICPPIYPPHIMAPKQKTSTKHPTSPLAHVFYTVYNRLNSVISVFVVVYH